MMSASERVAFRDRMSPEQRANAIAFACSLREGDRLLAATLEKKRAFDRAMERDWHLAEFDAEVVRRRPFRILTEREMERIVTQRVQKRQRKELRIQEARQRKALKGVLKQREDRRRVQIEQLVNLLQYSELPIRDIAARTLRSHRGVYQFQRNRRIKRPLSVRGKRGYDIRRPEANGIHMGRRV